MAAAVSDVDGLFQLPLDEFTAARNALAAQLKKAGRADDAERVKGLPKPSVPAWVVNQLYWRHRKAFDRLIAAGEKFRNAQAAQLAGKKSDLRELLDARRDTLSDLSRLAGTTLKHAGHNPSPDTLRRVTMTLEALATYGAHPGAPPAGRLTDDVDPPGFEAVAALIPQAGRSSTRLAAGGLTEPSRVLTFQQRERKPKKKQTPEEAEKQREEERKAAAAAARAAVQEAERTLRDARRAAEQAEAALKKAAARAKEAEKAKAELEKRWEKLVADADETRQEARRVASEAEDAAQEVADAERALEKARKEMDDL